jgi:hypothetical protein
LKGSYARTFLPFPAPPKRPNRIRLVDPGILPHFIGHHLGLLAAPCSVRIVGLTQLVVTTWILALVTALMTVGWCVYGTREMMSSAAREWEVTLREMAMVLGKEAART